MIDLHGENPGFSIPIRSKEHMIDDYDIEDEEWIEDEGDEDDCLLECPTCHAAVHEDTQKCPNCGDWIVAVYPHGRTKRIFVVGATLLLIAALLFIGTQILRALR